ncbi:hypothetical protein R5R35_013284 [Gryllus longicercus]|uniref:Uncharacterized protein n=1 Tax=Gryllus longicercus TaxID=2509291 RepID=A0AAN9W0U2_9ORTH
MRDRAPTVDGGGDGASGGGTPTSAPVPSAAAATELSQEAAERRSLKSGHARTHAIVINLDDRSRFTEEVTV